MKWLIIIWSLLNGIAGPGFFYLMIDTPPELIEEVNEADFYVGPIKLNLFFRGLYSSLLLMTGIGFILRKEWAFKTAYTGYTFQIIRSLWLLVSFGFDPYVQNTLIRAAIALFILTYLKNNRENFL